MVELFLLPDLILQVYAETMQGLWFHVFRQSFRGARARALVCALLTAFVFQNIVAASHFHNLRLDSGKGGAATTSELAANTSTKLGSNNGTKHNNDEGSNCSLCQAASLTSNFVVSSFSLFLPKPETLFVSLDERTIAVERFAAAWRSRAPPAL